MLEGFSKHLKQANQRKSTQLPKRSTFWHLPVAGHFSSTQKNTHFSLDDSRLLHEKWLEITIYIVGGGNSNIFMFNPNLGVRIQFDEHIFHICWFNHQLEIYFKLVILDSTVLGVLGLVQKEVKFLPKRRGTKLWRTMGWSHFSGYGVFFCDKKKNTKKENGVVFSDV